VTTTTPLALLLAALAALAAGCSLVQRPTRPTRCSAPAGLSATPAPGNRLAVILGMAAAGADSARVLFRVDAGPERATPFAPVRGERVRAPVLGLPAGARLSARIELWAGSARRLSPPVTCAIGALPRALAGIHLQTRYGQRSGGYILTEMLRGRTGYVVAFDSLGRIAWYHDLGPAHSTGDVKQQPNGDITAWAGSSFGYQPDSTGRFVELRPTGRLVREFRAPGGYYTDPHELRLVFAGDTLQAAYFFGYDLRHVRRLGGKGDGWLAAHTLFRRDAAGAVTPIVSGWQLFSLADTLAAPHDDMHDFEHPNSLDFDTDGNLLVSFRNFDQVVKIDARTGAVLWRLGGPRSDFRFVGDPLGGFAGQHYVRLLDDGDILLYDNRWSRPPLASRAAEYRLDLARHTATLVAAFRTHPRRYTDSTGSVQRLASGYTLVAYAHDYLIAEFNPRGEEVAEAAVTGAKKLGVGYRMLVVPSLYRYELP